MIRRSSGVSCLVNSAMVVPFCPALAVRPDLHRQPHMSFSGGQLILHSPEALHSNALLLIQSFDMIEYSFYHIFNRNKIEL